MRLFCFEQSQWFILILSFSICAHVDYEAPSGYVVNECLEMRVSLLLGQFPQPFNWTTSLFPWWPDQKATWGFLLLVLFSTYVSFQRPLKVLRSPLNSHHNPWIAILYSIYGLPDGLHNFRYYNKVVLYFMSKYYQANFETKTDLITLFVMKANSTPAFASLQEAGWSQFL